MNVGLRRTVQLYAYGMIFKNGIEVLLKRHEDNGVRDGGEGNITACLVVPLLEEQIPGTETCSYEGFTAAYMQDIYFPTA